MEEFNVIAFMPTVPANTIGAIIASELGFIGAVFVALGVLKLAPDTMAEISMTKWDFNSNTLTNLAAQRADFICGIPVMGLAFMVQIVNLLAVPSNIIINDPRGVVRICTLLLTAAVILPAVVARHLLARRFERASTRHICRRHAEHILAGTVLPGMHAERCLGDLIQYASRVDVLPSGDESAREFIARYLRSIDSQISSDIPDVFNTMPARRSTPV